MADPLVNVRLHEALAAVCPVTSVRVTGPASGSYDPAPSATGPQVAAADAALAAFDWSPAAHDAWSAARTGNPVLRHAKVRLAAPQQRTQTTLADVAGLSFQLKPNTHYAFSFVGAYTAAAATTGLALAVNGPASPAVLGVVGCIAESATACRQGVGVAYDTPLTGTASGGATRLPFWVDGNISTGAAGGTFTLRFASEVNGSAVTILAGSMGDLQEVGA